MVMPVMQRCPQCGMPFMGSDCIGRPCMDCEIGVESHRIARDVIDRLNRLTQLESQDKDHGMIDSHDDDEGGSGWLDMTHLNQM